MKYIFVVLPFDTEKPLGTTINIAHEVERSLDTDCKLIPSTTIPSFGHQEDIEPIDYLWHCLGGMKEADIVVFRPDWQESKTCTILHDIALAYGLDVLELDSEETEGVCPLCGNTKLSVMKLYVCEKECGKKYAVHCEECGAYGPFKDNDSFARDAWSNAGGAQNVAG